MEFKNTIGSTLNRWNVVRQKPLPIIHYNEKMKGIFQNDQLFPYYPSDHKSLTWYKKEFVHFFQMLVVNAQKLYNTANTDNPMKLYDLERLLWNITFLNNKDLHHSVPRKTLFKDNKAKNIGATCTKPLLSVPKWRKKIMK